MTDERLFLAVGTPGDTYVVIDLVGKSRPCSLSKMYPIRREQILPEEGRSSRMMQTFKGNYRIAISRDPAEQEEEIEKGDKSSSFGPRSGGQIDIR